MKHISNLLALGALILCAMCSVSCNKDNPREENYASVDFSFKITEVRHSKTFTWDVVANAVAIDPAEQELQELWITSYNTVTVTALPLAQGFEGVNYSSSDPKRVKVLKVDAQACTLEYVGDTAEGAPVTITAKAGEFTHSFKVFSKEVIPLEGVEFWHDFENDGNEVCHIAKTYGPNEYGEFNTFTGHSNIQPNRTKYERGPMHVRIGKLVPENASFRYVVKTKVEEHSNYPVMKDFVGYGDQRKDFSEFQGKETDMNYVYNNIEYNYVLFYFNVNTKEPQNKENRICGFYYTWYKE